jgi:hypothetical protein
MSDVPVWVWQGIAANLVSDALVAAGLLAWKYRGTLAEKLQRSSGEHVFIKKVYLMLVGNRFPYSAATNGHIRDSL